MKKILYIHQYFTTPMEGGAIRSYLIAKGMVGHGMQVELITSHNNPKYEQRTIEGIVVHYLPIRYSNSLTAKKRYFAFIKFVFASIRLSKNISKPSVVFASSTPLSVGIIALWIKWTRKIPYIFEVRDLWPEAPIQLGIIRSPLFKYFTRHLEKTIYRNAWQIIALSPGIEKGILDKYQKAEISMIPNMADVEFYSKKTLKLQEKKDFIVGYFGAFGMANGVEYILDLANECQKANLAIRFILIGSGAREKTLKEKIAHFGLTNVEILPHQNRIEIRSSMNAVDACFTSFLKIPVLETNSPNKFFDGLAAGKLSIVNTKGWLKDLVEQNNCGIYIDPDRREDFPTLIRPFLHNKQLLQSYGENALRLAKDNFSSEKLVNQICELFLK